MTTGEAQEDLEDLFEHAPCGYLSLDSQGVIVKSNATLSTMTGFPPEHLRGRRLRDLLNVAGRIFYETHFAPLLRMQGFFNEVALDLVTAQGERLAVLANARERRDANGDLLFTRVMIFPAAERRQYERGLVTARNTAEHLLASEKETALLREQFIAVLGHDLRNPLASIVSGVRLVLRQETSEKSREILTLMTQSATRMAALVDDLMDLARARLGSGISLELDDRSDLAATLMQIVEEMRSTQPERTIEAHFALDRPVKVDAARLAQMLSNLIGNALTHGAHDQPIRVDVVADADSLSLSVANQGDAIAPEVKERLFQPFFRGEVRASRQGLGLGLYISAQIAQAHGGVLDVASDANETRFTCRMPA